MENWQTKESANAIFSFTIMNIQMKTKLEFLHILEHVKTIVLVVMEILYPQTGVELIIISFGILNHLLPLVDSSYTFTFLSVYPFYSSSFVATFLVPLESLDEHSKKELKAINSTKDTILLALHLFASSSHRKTWWSFLHPLLAKWEPW